MDEECVILDLPEGLRLNLLGLIVEIEQIRIVADRAGLLGALLASLTCGGVESAERLEALAELIRSQQQGGAEESEEGDEEPDQERKPPPRRPRPKGSRRRQQEQ